MTLTIVWLLPLAGSLLIAALPPHVAKYMGVLVSLGTLFVTGIVAVLFAPDYHRFQFAEVLPWIPQLHVFYRLGVDGISVWLLVLNALLTVVAMLATPVAMRNVSRFLALMLAMSAGMSGVLMATDLVLFYVFWEAMLIPAYFLLWLFGEGERPGRAALKFVLFTLVGSLLMLVGVIGEYVFQNAGPGQQTFDLSRLHDVAPSQPSVQDRKSTRLNSSHSQISYAVFCLKKKKYHHQSQRGQSALLSRSSPHSHMVNGAIAAMTAMPYRVPPAISGHGALRRCFRVRRDPD